MHVNSKDLPAQVQTAAEFLCVLCNLVGKENTTVARRWEVHLPTLNEAAPSHLSHKVASFFTCYFRRSETKGAEAARSYKGNDSAYGVEARGWQCDARAKTGL